MLRTAAAITLFAAATAAQDDATAPQSLWSEASLYRDAWGTPHVYAESFRGMGFAFGYAQAEDHLEAVLMAYRAVNGRSAEVLGEERLPQDIYALRMRFGEMAADAYQTAHRDVQDLCEGFALGVNTWLLEHPDDAPEWAEGVEPKDVLALMHAFLLAHVPLDLPEMDVRDRGLLSAHAWAVAPENSRTGNAMLAGSLHAEFDGMYRWCEAHLSALGYDMTGGTICGLPVLLTGANPYLAWTIAPNEADVADVYDEESTDHLESSLEYKRVYVKTNDGLEARDIRRWRSPRGPVVATNLGRPLAWKVGGYGNFGALEQFLDMGFARTFEEFENAIARLHLPAMNVVYADRDGNIFFAYLAIAAERDNPVFVPAGENAQTIWEKPVSPNNPEHMWGEPISYDGLPVLLNPQSGYLVGAGAPPWLTSTDSGLNAPRDSGALIRDRDTPAARRARELFDRGPKSPRDLQAMVFDRAANDFQLYIQLLRQARKELPRKVRDGHPDLPAIIDMLTGWNGVADTDSVAMTFFHVWNRLLESRFARVENFSRTSLEAVLEDPTDSALEFMLDTASEAARLMIDAYGSSFVPWGEVHALSRGEHRVSLAGGDSGSPIFWSADKSYEDGLWNTDAGYAYTFMVELSEPVAFLSALPFGASDREDSPHFADQMPLLRDRRLKVMPTERWSVLAGANTGRGRSLEFVNPDQDVRMRVSAENPIKGSMLSAETFRRRLEEDLVPFSDYVEPAIEPVHEEPTIEVLFSIPESYCAREDLDKLGVYAYHPEEGWSYVYEQSLDADARLFTARDYLAQVYVVLGPASVRHAGAVSRPSVPQTDDATTILQTEARREQHVAPRTESANDAPFNADERRIREPRPEPRPVGNFSENPFGASAGVLSYDADRQRESAEIEDPLSVARPDLIPESVPGSPVERQPDRTTERSTDQTAEPSRSSEPGHASSGRDQTDGSGYELDETPGGTIVVRGSGRNNRRGAETDRLTWSDDVPERLRRETSPRERFRMQLAPSAAQASELLIGKSLQLQPPGGSMLFHLTAEQTVRAQAFVTDPPAPFPEGLTNYTDVYSVRRDSESVPCTVGIVARLNPEVAAPESVEKLALYYFDEQQGWRPLPNSSRATPLSLQGLDVDARTYVVLGPASGRLTNP